MQKVQILALLQISYVTLHKHPGASVAIAKQRYCFLPSTACLMCKLLRTNIFTYDFTEQHLIQYGPDFWLGPLAASMLPIINKNKAALFCNNDSPGLLSRQA